MTTEPTPPTLDLAALTEIAKGATQDTWWPAIVDNIVFAGTGSGGDIEVADVSLYRDSLHIAAFDPPTVLALIARAEAAEAKVARVEARHAGNGHSCENCFDSQGFWENYPCPEKRALDAGA